MIIATINDYQVEFERPEEYVMWMHMIWDDIPLGQIIHVRAGCVDAFRITMLTEEWENA